MSLIPRLIFKASRLWWHITRPITVGVRLLLVKENTVLLVKHTYQKTHWFLVGGGVKRNENLFEAAHRGAREEVGFFPLDNLPVNLASGHKRRIQEYLEDGRNLPLVGMW